MSEPRRPARDRRVPPGVRLAGLEELEVEVEKLVAGGEGLARHDGIPIFVPRSAPGDRLRVRLTERRPDYGRAEIVEVLAEGPGRRQPPCPYFERCGGCDLQHLADDLQPQLKAEAVRETLERLGGVAVPEPVAIVTGDAWGYRLRTQLHVEPGDQEARVGYFERRSHRLVAVAACPILVGELEALLPRLPALLAGRRLRRLDLAAGGAPPGEEAAVTTAPVVAGLPHGEVALEVAGRTYAYDARVFFQAHRGLAGRLAAAAVGEHEGEAAYDLYAGAGLFSLPLAARYRRVTAVEGERVAARFCRTNARRNRIGNLEVINQALETWMPQLPEGVDRVIVDPPRGGLTQPVRRALATQRPRRLTYVSCHAATLARDLKTLKELYRLESLTLLDLFPQSGHMEAVVQLVLAEGASG